MGSTTLERECWARVFSDHTWDYDLHSTVDYDRPCILLRQAYFLEQLAAKEADNIRRFPLTTPGLADAMQRHISAYVGRPRRRARRSPRPPWEADDVTAWPAARHGFRAAKDAFDAAEKHFRTICG